tara:strand:- start:4544 stop:5170 length:627 start_codon:yes stop_codon:yes gene_type:complete
MKAFRLPLKIFLAFSIMTLLSACDTPPPPLRHLSPQDVIVAFGDSLTAGKGTTKENSYPAKLSKIINIEVINEGISGDESADGLARISSVLKKHHPRLVILALGGNDQLRKRKAAQTKENLKNIILLIRESGADIMLIAPPSFTIGLSAPDFYTELGDKFDIPVDTTTLPSLLKDPDMKSDYIHLNAKGYQALAESIAETLKKTGARQ